MKRKVKFLGLALFALAALAALAGIVMLLWNAVVPGVFVAARPLDYVHAAGLLVLCRILFGGFRGGRRGWHGGRHGGRWQELTPEERERLQRRFGAMRAGREAAATAAPDDAR